MRARRTSEQKIKIQELKDSVSITDVLQYMVLLITNLDGQHAFGACEFEARARMTTERRLIRCPERVLDVVGHDVAALEGKAIGAIIIVIVC